MREMPPGDNRPGQPLAQWVLTWSLIGVCALLLTLRSNLFRPTIHGLQLSAEIVQQSRDYHDQIRNNDALEQEIIFLRSEPGKKWAVHKYTGKVEPGETVGQAVEQPPSAPPAMSGRERANHWFSQAATAGENRLHDWGQIVACYSGRRPPDQSPSDSNKKKTGLSKKQKAAASVQRGTPEPAAPAKSPEAGTGHGSG